MATDETVDGAEAAATPQQRRALFRVVRGTPSDEELAALTVVLAAAASAAGPPEPARVPDRWSAPSVQHRRELFPGRGAWQATYWPR